MSHPNTLTWRVSVGGCVQRGGGGNNARREKGGDGCIVLQIGMKIREKISIFVHYSTLILPFFFGHS